MRIVIIILCFYLFFPINNAWSQSGHTIDFGTKYPKAWVNDYYKAFDWTGELTSGMYTANPKVANGYFTVDVYVERTTEWTSSYNGFTSASTVCNGRGKTNYKNTLGGFTIVFEGTFGDRFDKEQNQFVLSPEIAKRIALPESDCRWEQDAADYVVSPTVIDRVDLKGYSVLTVTYKANTSPNLGEIGEYILLPLHEPYYLGTLKLKITDPTKKTHITLSTIDCFGQVFSSQASETGYGARYKRTGWLDVNPDGIPLGEVEIEPEVPVIASGETEICNGGVGTYKLKAFPANAENVKWIVSEGVPATSDADQSANATITKIFEQGDSIKVQFNKKALYYINAYSVAGSKVSVIAQYAQTVNVLEPPALTLTSSTPTPVCAGSKVTLTAAGVADGQYVWSDNAAIKDGVRDVNPVTTTTYTVQAGTGGCMAEKSVEVQVKQLPVISVTPTGKQMLCAGEEIIYTATDATITYTWSWSGGTATGQVFKDKPLVNMEYTLVGQKDGCNSLPVKLAVDVSPRPTITWVGSLPEQVNVNANFTAEVLASGTTGTYHYYWLQPDGQAGPDMKKRTFTAQPKDYYFAVYAEDAGGCKSDTLQDTVTVFVPKVRVKADSMYAFCQGGANILKTEILPGESAGPYYYAWYKAGNETSILGQNSTLYVDGAGDYVVKVTDSSPTPLVGYDTIQLTSVKPTTIKTVAVTPLRIVSESRTILMADVTGGVVKSWNWGPQSGFDLASESVKQYPLTKLLSSTQKYGVYVVGDDGCMSKTDTVIVNVDNNNGIKLIAEANTRSTCKDGDIYLNASVTGGTGATIYNWIPTNGLSAANIQKPVFSSASAGNYTFLVQVTKGTGKAIASVDLEVKDLQAPILALTKGSKDCVGDTIKLQNTGTTGTIKWFLDGVALTGTDTYCLIQKSGLTYMATTQTVQGCEDTIKMDVTPNQKPILNWTTPLAANVVNGTPINATVKPSGGMNPYVCYWTSPTTRTGESYPTITADYATGKYHFAVYAIDSKSCKSDTLKATVNVVPPSLKVDIDSAFRYCRGGMNTLRLVKDVTGGNGDYKYKWYVAGSPNDPQSTTKDGFTFKEADYGDVWFVLEVSDGSTPKIYGYDTVKLSTKGYEAPVVSAGPNQFVKLNTPVVLLGSVVKGTPTTWKWDGLLMPGEENKQYAQTTPIDGFRSYTLYATDVNNCRSVDAKTNVDVAVNGLYVEATPANSVICLKNTVKLNVKVTGATNSLTYEWFVVPGKGDISQFSATDIQNPVFIADKAGDQQYVVKVTEAVTGRVATAMISITVNNAQVPVLNFADKNKSCEGDTLMITNTGVTATNYKWYLDGVLQVNDKVPTIFVVETEGVHVVKVTATDNSGVCVADTISASVTIYKRPQLLVWETAPSQSVNVGDPITAKVGKAQDGLGPNYTYHWTSPSVTLGQTYTIASAADIGSYNFSAYAKDQRGCRSLPLEGTTVVLGARLAVEAGVEGGNTTVCLGSKANMSVTKITGGGSLNWEDYTYKWFPKGKGATILSVDRICEIGPFTAVSDVEYVVEVKEKNGSRLGYDTISFTRLSLSAPAITKISAQDSCGKGVIVVAATDASTYIWKIEKGTGAVDSKNQTNFNITSLGAYKVMVEVSGKGGANVCKDIDSLSGTTYVLPVINVTPDHQVIAKGETVTMNATATPSAIANVSWKEKAYLSSVSGDGLSVTTRPLSADREFVVTAANKLASQCKSDDTVNIYMYPDPPVLDIDTNINRKNIKLSWEYDTTVDSISIMSIKWDGYNVLKKEYQERALLKNIKSNTIWAENDMRDTLRFYYAQNIRNIKGKSYRSGTSDTLGYLKQTLMTERTAGFGAKNYVAYPFDMSQRGIKSGYDLGDYIGWGMSEGNPIHLCNTISALDFTSQKELNASYYDFGPDFRGWDSIMIASYNKFLIKPGDVVVVALYFDSPINDVELVLFGKLPKKFSYNLQLEKTLGAGANNFVLSPLALPGYCLRSTLGDMVPKINALSVWNFAIQKWVMTSKLPEDWGMSPPDDWEPARGSIDDLQYMINTWLPIQITVTEDVKNWTK